MFITITCGNEECLKTISMPVYAPYKYCPSCSHEYTVHGVSPEKIAQETQDSEARFNIVIKRGMWVACSFLVLGLVFAIASMGFFKNSMIFTALSLGSLVTAASVVGIYHYLALKSRGQIRSDVQ